MREDQNEEYAIHDKYTIYIYKSMVKIKREKKLIETKIGFNEKEKKCFDEF